MHDFRSLIVWRLAHALAVDIHRDTLRLPRDEWFALRDQMRRAATSVPFNIAEGCGRKVAGRSNVELLRFLAIASGSLHELDSQVEYARDVGYLPVELADECLRRIDDLEKKLAGLVKHLRAHDRHPAR